jgi:methyltransferase (TIGR00027 family)
MSRTDADSWDLASSVGATATMVAAARALASKEPNPLIDDPYAAALVRAVGVDFFTRLVDGEIPLSTIEGDGPRVMAGVMAVRTRFFDDFFITATGGGNFITATGGGNSITATGGGNSITATGGGNSITATGGGNPTNAGAAGIRQAVILASGLDSRPYRLPWPQGTTVYEIDQPKVIEFKTTTMTAIGATPTAERRTVAIDLREDWPAALRHSGFDEAQPTAWSAEGLLAYLPPEAQDRLFDSITALSAPGSQLATEYHPDAGASIGERAAAMRSQWKQHGFDVDLSKLFYPGERNSVVDYLTDHGWQVNARSRPEVFEGYGREFPDAEELAPLRNSLAVIATLK